MGGEYGWPQDAVDGALYALVATGSLRARLNGSPVNATAIPQNSIGTVAYQVENVVLPAGVKIAVKGLATKLGIPVAGLAEADIPPRIVDRLLALANEAGGDAPLPAAPSNETVRDLQGLTGNELTQHIYDRKDDLLAQTEAWTALAVEEGAAPGGMGRPGRAPPPRRRRRREERGRRPSAMRSSRIAACSRIRTRLVR